MAGRPTKVDARTWIETARQALIEEGVTGLKVDRLAARLGVTRGGFYHNYKDRDALLEALLADWAKACRFTPPLPAHDTAAEAARWFDTFSTRLIEETGYDHEFDMAVREWGRADAHAGRAIEAADADRIATLVTLFGALGYSHGEAAIRARVFYYHQIGYYAMNVRESEAERKRNAPIYLDILCGHERLEAARDVGRLGNDRATGAGATAA